MLGRLALQHYREWEIERNEMADEDRAQLSWNDRNYERLQFGITAFWWTFAVVLGAFATWYIGVRSEWWCWPYQC